MALNLASPGIVVREVDLTVGRVAPTSNKIGAIVAPFAKGPVGSPILVENEQDLLNNFGEPYAVDKHYEHWLTASSYLAYGGSLRVIRSDDSDLKNGFVGTASSVKVKSLDHYLELGFSENPISGVTVVARNPGSWSNGIRVGLIDAKADQILGVSTTNIIVGHGVTQSVVGKVKAGAGGTSVLDGVLKGIVTEIGAGKLSVKVLSHVSAAGTETVVDYQPAGIYSFSTTAQLGITTANGTLAVLTLAPTSQIDWFDQQNLTIATAPVGSATTEITIPWNTVADRPFTSDYANTRGARFDEFHIVVIDASGSITGNAGTILEKHLNISKASDAQYSVGSPAYWRKYLENNSRFIFGGSAPAGITSTGFSSGFVPQTDFAWDQEADSAIFGSIGTKNFVLSGGKNYDGSTTIAATGALTSTISDISSGYDLFENTDNYKVDFLLMGSANYTMENAQALAEKLISVAELRKDALAFISPYRGSALTDTSDQTAVTVRSASDITDKVLQFYSPITSSTYAVFDSGYKYMYDRFSDTFRYVPLNGDIAGTCARNDINNFPWYSPAGTSRGAILNAVKLAYNPSKSQRDRLYSNRINPIIFSPGAGIVLFGDKTGYGKASAFDRINVRRLFVYLETAIAAAAKDQLFEFNDEITRTNFVNIVEPFLRDVQAKRGIYDYVVVCDETNNTAAVIDSNEFVADIYIKPARSINFIGLTFVATRTGVSFDEVIGQF